MELWIKGLLLALLMIGSVEDWRNHSIHTWYPMAFFSGALLRQVLCPAFSMWMFVGGIALGGAFFVLSKIKSGVLGAGDGLVLGVCGAYIGVWGVTTMFIRGIFLAAIWGVLRLALQWIQSGRCVNGEMPFIPCLLAAYLTMLW
ncbi:MAG: hypothetical protein E7277_09280 [Lachnospiraceae bacterium]|nr:hypothetical protein [Lachnospiraceae bacterium]